MGDLIERLRMYAGSEVEPDMTKRPMPLRVGPLMFRYACMEAADEIERLRARTALMEKFIKGVARVPESSPSGGRNVMSSGEYALNLIVRQAHILVADGQEAPQPTDDRKEA